MVIVFFILCMNGSIKRQPIPCGKTQHKQPANRVHPPVRPARPLTVNVKYEKYLCMDTRTRAASPLCTSNLVYN